MSMHDMTSHLDIECPGGCDDFKEVVSHHYFTERREHTQTTGWAPPAGLTNAFSSSKL